MTMCNNVSTSRCINNRPMGDALYVGRKDYFLFNSERSRLEKIIFGMYMYDDNFMADIRYLWSDCLLMGQKSLENYILTIGFI